MLQTLSPPVAEFLDASRIGDVQAASRSLAAASRQDLTDYEFRQIEHGFVTIFSARPEMAAQMEYDLGSNARVADATIWLRAESLFRAASGKLSPEARAEVERLVSSGDGYASDLYTGALQMIDREIPRAYQSFIRANRFRKHPRMFIGCASVRPYGEDWRGAVHDKFGPVMLRRGPKGRASVVFTGDQRYFLNFAHHLVQSVQATGSRMSIHFHVIGWSDACEALAGRLDATISSEDIGAPDDRTWFATARFYRLATFLDWFGDVVLADMDIDVVRRPEGAVDGDVGVRYSEALDRFPWWAVTGGCLYAGSTQAGLEFARSLKDYIAARFVAGRTHWWFDQLALYDVTHALKDSMKLGDSHKVAGVIKTRPGGEIEHLKR